VWGILKALFYMQVENQIYNETMSSVFSGSSGLIRVCQQPSSNRAEAHVPCSLPGSRLHWGEPPGGGALLRKQHTAC